MKPNPLACLLLLAIACRLLAQQPVSPSDTNATRSQTIATWFSKVTITTTTKTNDSIESVTAYRTNAVSGAELAAIKSKAESGDLVAQYQLGKLYGWGVAGTNLDEDMIWIRKAAVQGLPEAQMDVGWSFYKKDSAEALRWFRKAADQGYPEAQCTVGQCYSNGEGTTVNNHEAFIWYSKAAENGESDAQHNLAAFYSNGTGIAADAAKAAYWNRRAAAQGNADSQRWLGIAYEAGNGVPQNYIEAYKWLNIAAAQGLPEAAEHRDQLAANMTPEQISKGQRLSATFVPKGETPGSASDDSSLPENPTASGTGFFITDDGYLISNYHVVKDATKVRLLTGAGLIDAKVVQVDAANDLALLKADGRFALLPIAASRTMALGGTVATVGFPDIGLQGFAPKLAKGEIASLSGAGDDPRYFQISVPVQPGNSGGALVDGRGNVIGIVSAKLDAGAALAASGELPENVNYAVKSSLLLSFLESVPAVSAKLKAPVTVNEKFEDVVKSAQDAAVLVLVY
jgi:TPR repeat protein